MSVSDKAVQIDLTLPVRIVITATSVAPPPSAPHAPYTLDVSLPGQHQLPSPFFVRPVPPFVIASSFSSDPVLPSYTIELDRFGNLVFTNISPFQAKTVIGFQVDAYSSIGVDNTTLAETENGWFGWGTPQKDTDPISGKVVLSVASGIGTQFSRITRSVSVNPMPVITAEKKSVLLITITTTFEMVVNILRSGSGQELKQYGPAPVQYEAVLLIGASDSKEASRLDNDGGTQVTCHSKADPPDCDGDSCPAWFQGFEGNQLAANPMVNSIGKVILPHPGDPVAQSMEVYQMPISPDS